MPKVKRKKKRLFPRKFFLFLGVALITLPILLGAGIYYTLLNHLPDTSLTGEELIAEEEQNYIPRDVLAQVQKEEHVLGAKSTASIKPISVHVPILMYHYVEYIQDTGDTKRISLTTTPDTLEQEIKTLQDAGYTFITNAELTSMLDGKTKLPKKPIVLTFDDGYRDFYTDAYPILKKYHVKATEYVIADYPYFNTPNHLTTAQLVEIAGDGLVEIGSHTVHHVWLKNETLATDQYEITQSKKMLENIIHKPVISFAYPFGAFDQQAINVVKQAGYTSAVSTIAGIDQPQTHRFFLYRLRPGGRLGQDLLNWLESIQNT